MRLIDGDALLEKMMHRHEYVGRPSDPECLIEDAPTMMGWISVEDRLPEETESMFARFHGTEKWDNAMWLKESKQVIVAIEFSDGGRRVTLGRLHDSEWHTAVSVILPHTVTHWMPFPEPPNEVKKDE